MKNSSRLARGVVDIPDHTVLLWYRISTAFPEIQAKAGVLLVHPFDEFVRVGGLVCIHVLHLVVQTGYI